jgi:hypothetical protein
LFVTRVCPNVAVAGRVAVPASLAISVFTADVDGDGRLDVLSASFSDNKIAWYRNTAGTGPITWATATISTGATGARGVHAADIDLDGRLDVVSASMSNNQLAWYRNGGGASPTFTTFVVTTAASSPRSVETGDVDGDGRVDLVVASFSDNRVSWWRNVAGSPITWTQVSVSTAETGARSARVVDLDSDGDIDIISGAESANRIAWHRNDGGGTTWTTFVLSTAASAPYMVFAADVNGDGRRDVLSASANDDKIALYTSSICLGGTSGTNGALPCTTCSTGRYSLSMASSCTQCPAGRFGSTTGLSTIQCSGPCPAGCATFRAHVLACARSRV